MIESDQGPVPTNEGGSNNVDRGARGLQQTVENVAISMAFKIAVGAFGGLREAKRRREEASQGEVIAPGPDIVEQQ